MPNLIGRVAAAEWQPPSGSHCSGDMRDGDTGESLQQTYKMVVDERATAPSYSLGAIG